MDRSLEYIDPQQRILRLAFLRNGDRFQQRLSLHCGDADTLLLESTEGDDSQAWPQSPPMQDLSVERRRSGDVALLVGMSGKSHFSLSVEVIENGLEFDVACRVSGAAAMLGSSYHSELPLQDRRIAAPGKACSLLAETDDIWRNTEGGFTISPLLKDAGTTARWRYRFVLSD